MNLTNCRCQTPIQSHLRSELFLDRLPFSALNPKSTDLAGVCLQSPLSLVIIHIHHAPCRSAMPQTVMHDPPLVRAIEQDPISSPLRHQFIHLITISHLFKPRVHIPGPDKRPLPPRRRYRPTQARRLVLDFHPALPIILDVYYPPTVTQLPSSNDC